MYVQAQQITPQLALQVLLQFDKAINTALANRVRNRVNFRVSSSSYCIYFSLSDIYIFILHWIEFSIRRLWTGIKIAVVLDVHFSLTGNLNVFNVRCCVWTVVSPCHCVSILQGSLNTYRFCDNVWTFVLNDVEFREVTDLVKVDKVKIVACDGKSESTQNKTDKW